MAHVRSTLRDAAVSALKTGVTLVEGRVEDGQVYAGGAWPRLAVSTPRETIEPSESAMRDVAGPQERRIELVVEARTKAADGALTAALDALAVQIEAALLAEPTLAGTVDWLDLVGTEYESTDEQEQPTGVLTLTFVAWLRTHAGDGETKVT